MADIETLLGLGVRPEDNMQALADKLRGQQRTGQFFGMSEIAPIANLGNSLNTGSVDAAKRGGVLLQALEKQKEAKSMAANKLLQAKQMAEAAEATRVQERGADRANTVLDAQTKQTNDLALIDARKVADELEIGDFKAYEDADGNKFQLARKGDKVFEHDEEGNIFQSTTQGKFPSKKSGSGSSSNANLYPNKWSSAGERKKFEKDASDFMVQTSAFNSYKPDFSNSVEVFGEEVEGLPLVSGIENFVARNAPILTDEKSEEKSKWWSDYKKYYENIERHGLFGSALTNAEQAIWKASNLSENMTDEQMKASLATLKSVIKKRMDQAVGVAKAKNWPEEYVNANIEWLGDEGNTLDSETGNVPLAVNAPSGGFTIRKKP